MFGINSISLPYLLLLVAANYLNNAEAKTKQNLTVTGTNMAANLKSNCKTTLNSLQINYVIKRLTICCVVATLKSIIKQRVCAKIIKTTAKLSKGC